MFVPATKVVAFESVLILIGISSNAGKMMDQYQPRARALPRNEYAKEEIRNFLLAVNSYPECAAKNPSLTFEQYLSSLLADRPKDSAAS